MRGVGFGISKRWAGAEGPGSVPGEPVWAPLICHSSAISGQPANAPDAWVRVVLPHPVLYPFSPNTKYGNLSCIYLGHQFAPGSLPSL